MINPLLDYFFSGYEIYMTISFVCSLCLAIKWYDKNRYNFFDSIVEFFIIWIGFPLVVYFILTRYIFKTKHLTNF
jgi:purine-cytosine permease-like protein